MIINHEIYYPLYQNTYKPIILITGGRASGKSFSVSTFIERLTFQLKKYINDNGEVEKIVHNILYCRYTMVSANISVIPEFMEKIDADGTTKYFSRTKSDVTNIMTGSRIMFRGIKTSSGNQTAKLKSIHGITTFVCDEAEEWSNEQEFDTIALSIRQKGIQNRIIIIMNPTDSNHFIYQKYIKDTHIDVEYDGVPVQISTHPDVLHIHTTYLDNIEHLSDTFLKEVQTMKETNPDKYAHVVMGKWSDVAEGAIYTNWSVIKEMPHYTQLRWRGRGLDIGYTHDPSACVYCGIDKDNNLYIDEQFYRTGMLPSDLIKELKASPNAADTFVYADCAAPQYIDEIFLGGVMIYGSNKNGGVSKVAGIEKMKDFNHIYITERSYNVQNEFRNYTWAKDKNGNYINEPIDAYDHACFIGNTVVETLIGDKRIDELKVGDLVLTQSGYKRVTRFYDNGVKKCKHIRLHFKNYITELVVTPDHKIKTTQGWVEIQNLKEGQKIYLTKSSKGRSITYTKAKDISRVQTSDYMSQYGSSTTEKYQKDFTYTIKIKTLGITTLATLNWWSIRNTYQTMCKNVCKTLMSWKKCVKQWVMRRSSLTSGTEVKKGESGIDNTQKWSQTTYNLKSSFARIAESIFGRNRKDKSSSALTLVNPLGEESKDLTISKANASIVVRLSSLINTSRKTIAKIVNKCIGQKEQRSLMRTGEEMIKADSILKLEVLGDSEEHVYDIEVEDSHEFVANGVLVHNCDATRYYIMGRILGLIVKPKKIKNEANAVIF